MYILGGMTSSFIIAALYGIASGLNNNQGIAQQGVNYATFLSIFGFLVGVIIIILSATMLGSSRRRVRQIGGILVIIVALLGAINTLGGLIIGIILSVVGAVGAMTYNGN